MAMISPKGGSFHSFKYEVTYHTERLTILQAISKALEGAMNPCEIYNQFPTGMRSNFDNHSCETHGSNFLSLSLSDQKTVLQSILDMANGKHRDMTLLEAMERASGGLFSPRVLFEQMPPEMKMQLDGFAKKKYSCTFLSLDPNKQKLIIKQSVQYLMREEQNRPISLREAIEAVQRREINADLVYRQLPSEVKNIIENISKDLFNAEYQTLSSEKKNRLFEELLRYIRRTEANSQDESKNCQLSDELLRLEQLGSRCLNDSDFEKAVPPFRRVIDILDQMIALNPKNTSLLAALTVFRNKFGFASIQLAERLDQQNNRKDAIQVIQNALKSIRDGLSGKDPQNDLDGWSAACCNLSCALALYGDWIEDVNALTEAIDLARKALDLLNPKDRTFNWGATMDNLGHALFRLGELENDIHKVREGNLILKEAVEHFRSMKNTGAVDHVERHLTRAKESMAKMVDRQTKTSYDKMTGRTKPWYAFWKRK